MKRRLDRLEAEADRRAPRPNHDDEVADLLAGLTDAQLDELEALCLAAERDPAAKARHYEGCTKLWDDYLARKTHRRAQEARSAPKMGGCLTLKDDRGL